LFVTTVRHLHIISNLFPLLRYGKAYQHTPVTAPSWPVCSATSPSSESLPKKRNPGLLVAFSRFSNDFFESVEFFPYASALIIAALRCCVRLAYCCLVMLALMIASLETWILASSPALLPSGVAGTISMSVSVSEENVTQEAASFILSLSA